MRAQYLLSALMAAVAAQSDDSSSPVEPCAAAASSQAASLQASPPEVPADTIFASIDAQTAWDCVQSVAFDANNAPTMLAAIRQYLSMHTNIAYLKNPPKAYQQPALDVMGRLDRISDKIQSGAYTRQWDFDMDLYSIEVDAHDEHFNIGVGTWGVFRWMLPYRLTTISHDGKELPQVYVYEDVRDQVSNISPVDQIEGKSVFDYLHAFNAKAAAAGLSDPHAEWNVLMWNEGYQFGEIGSHANGPTYSPNLFEATTIYNGNSLSGKFANGSTFEWQYTAGTRYDLRKNLINDGKSFFDELIANPNVIPITPTAVNPAAVSTAFNAPTDTSTYLAASTTSTSRATSTAVSSGNYPNPDTQQDDFGLGGTVSGYLLQDASIGVLSLPSFESSGDSASFSSFSAAVSDFINKASGMKKVVIDIRGNTGGTFLLGYDTFKLFFPTIEPSVLFRTRATDILNTIGKAFTALTDNTGGILPPQAQEEALKYVGTAGFIDSSVTVDSDGDKWGEWADYYGPLQIYGDQFTNNARWNLSDEYLAASVGSVIAGYGNRTLDYAQPWQAEDIIILSDGVCGSTCSVFAELMKTDGGVRFVSIGGIPENGPMQAISGTRGMNAIPWDFIGDQVEGFKELIVAGQDKALAILKYFGISEEDLYSLPTPIQALPWHINGRFNSLDEIRASDPQDPLQFTYEASDCRMFYTGDMIRDVTVTWKAASKALDSGDDICVKGSKDGKGVKINDTVTDDPGISNDKDWKAANTTDPPSAAPHSLGSPSALMTLTALTLAMLAL